MRIIDFFKKRKKSHYKIHPKASNRSNLLYQDIFSELCFNLNGDNACKATISLREIFTQKTAAAFKTEIENIVEGQASEDRWRMLQSLFAINHLPLSLFQSAVNKFIFQNKVYLSDLAVMTPPISFDSLEQTQKLYHELIKQLFLLFKMGDIVAPGNLLRLRIAFLATQLTSLLETPYRKNHAHLFSFFSTIASYDNALNACLDQLTLFQTKLHTILNSKSAMLWLMTHLNQQIDQHLKILEDAQITIRAFEDNHPLPAPISATLQQFIDNCNFLKDSYRFTYRP